MGRPAPLQRAARDDPECEVRRGRRWHLVRRALVLILVAARSVDRRRGVIILGVQHIRQIELEWGLIAPDEKTGIALEWIPYSVRYRRDPGHLGREHTCATDLMEIAVCCLRNRLRKTAGRANAGNRSKRSSIIAADHPETGPQRRNDTLKRIPAPPSTARQLYRRLQPALHAYGGGPEDGRELRLHQRATTRVGLVRKSAAANT